MRLTYFLLEYQGSKPTYAKEKRKMFENCWLSKVGYGRLCRTHSNKKKPTSQKMVPMVLSAHQHDVAI